MACNICGGNKFNIWRGRVDEQCDSCGALARHRMAWAVYNKFVFNKHPDASDLKVLHLAPEACLYPALQEKLSAGYICADASPDIYPHAPCLKLYFPRDFQIFPDGYFDLILHNHVLEHIPGHYGDHLMAFARMVKPGGQMILSVPGPYMNMQSIEGGENLANDSERLEKFLQEDHFKLLGADFVEFLDSMSGGRLSRDGISNEVRKSLNVRPDKAPFFIWKRD